MASKKTYKKTDKIKTNVRAWEHFDHQKDVTGVGPIKTKKQYTRKSKHKNKLMEEFNEYFKN